MKKFLILLAGLALASCQTVRSDSPSCMGGGVASETKMDERAYAAALLLYNVPAQAYKAADEQGLLPADIKSKARMILLRMYTTLRIVQQAYQAGDTSSFQCHLGNLQRASTEVDALLGVK